MPDALPIRGAPAPSGRREGGAPRRLHVLDLDAALRGMAMVRMMIEVIDEMWDEADASDELMELMEIETLLQSRLRRLRRRAIQLGWKEPDAAPL